MILRVGPFLYRVRFVDGYIEHEGDQCLGLCDNDAHELLVSTQTSEAQQIQVICHEYMEAWLFHFGSNVKDKEDYCDLFGMAMTQFVLDFTRQLQQPITPQPDTARNTDGDADTNTNANANLDADADTDAATMRRCLDHAIDTEPDAPADADADTAAAENVARKLAQHAARVGLTIRHVYDGKPQPAASRIARTGKRRPQP